MPYLDSWDSSLFGAKWDSGLQWDVNVGSNLGDVTRYLNLITNEHNLLPNYMAMIAGVLQPFADNEEQLLEMPEAYDLDQAVGAQLDTVGLWVGQSRTLTIPLNNPWFSWNVSGQGWNQAAWRDPTQPTTTTIVLPDDSYRTLLRARIVNNTWDGTIPGAYTVWNTLFLNTGWTINIKDNGDMTMTFTLRGPPPDTITSALLTGGSFDLAPAGVLATYGYSP
jgi:hypothetical protein